jgi:hypothetical protein
VPISNRSHTPTAPSSLISAMRHHIHIMVVVFFNILATQILQSQLKMEDARFLISVIGPHNGHPIYGSTAFLLDLDRFSVSWLLTSWTWDQPRGLRHEMSSSAQTLRSRVRIPLEAWMYVCVYSVFLLPPVLVTALRRADPPSKEPYRLRKKIKKLKKWPRSNKGL